MPLPIKLILFFLVINISFVGLTLFDFFPEVSALTFRDRLYCLLAAVPSLVALILILQRKKSALLVVMLSWFSANLWGLLIEDNREVSGDYWYLVVGFVTLMGCVLWWYLKTSQQIYSYFQK